MNKTDQRTSLFLWLVRKLLRTRSGLSLIALAGLMVAGRMAWQAIEPTVSNRPEFQLTADQVFVNPPLPAWIRTDVKREALRNASLERPMSLLTPNLVEQFAQAFKLHPWVAQVVEVRKSAGPRLDVQLVYRRPVCMVEVPGGLYAVDPQAVLLPSSDFTADDAQRYPRLVGIRTVTEGPVGTPWRDLAVSDAASIAALLVDNWAAWGLLRMAPADEANESVLTGAPQFVIESNNGSKIIWGHAPRATSAGELSPQEKLARLATLASSGQLTTAGQGGQIDLRHATAPSAPPRTAEGTAEPKR
jgi:hypothetical protein